MFPGGRSPFANTLESFEIADALAALLIVRRSNLPAPFMHANGTSRCRSLPGGQASLCSRPLSQCGSSMVQKGAVVRFDEVLQTGPA